ncbi:TRAP transporter substrate-binding protein [Ammoniphilus resinae]|uniref:Tripartite ATP-independent transporter DctP family solute receptor n=1 Tax=Ammoniphilus resinae TaxID=861532 RepID=A0ABS4GL14_9BACL|nr:TRAP transporter substrate-binding protein [Ammoniphilus resinae]MBP1930936.1 tripartite ATP-independent transporter DctP family solute receptor [Ammoniphilus resinae]
MKKMLSAFVLVPTLAMGTILSGCGNQSEATNSNTTSSSKGTKSNSTPEKVVELNIGHTLSPESHWNLTALKLKELVEAKSNGSMIVNVFPQSQLGGEVKMIQALRTGTQALVFTAQATLANTVPEYSIFDLPYLFDDIDQANQVLRGEAGDLFLDMLPKYDLVGLGWTATMERDVFSNKPIEKVDDMSGFKIRIMQAPGYVKAYEALGAQPTPMAYSEVYLSLQQGVVDGADTSPDQFIMDKFIEVAKYFNLTHVHYLPTVALASKKVWDNLTPEQQKILQESMDEASEFGVKEYKKQYDEGIEKMEEAGVTVVETDTESLKDASEKVHDELIKEIPDGQKLFDAIQEAKKG